MGEGRRRDPLPTTIHSTVLVRPSFLHLPEPCVLACGTLGLTCKGSRIVLWVDLMFLFVFVFVCRSLRFFRLCAFLLDICVLYLHFMRLTEDLYEEMCVCVCVCVCVCARVDQVVFPPESPTWICFLHSILLHLSSVSSFSYYFTILFCIMFFYSYVLILPPFPFFSLYFMFLSDLFRSTVFPLPFFPSLPSILSVIFLLLSSSFFFSSVLSSSFTFPSTFLPHRLPSFPFLPSTPIPRPSKATPTQTRMNTQ